MSINTLTLSLRYDGMLTKIDDIDVVYDLDDLSNDYSFIVVTKNILSTTNHEFKRKIDNSGKYKVIYLNYHEFYLLNISPYQQYEFYRVQPFHYKAYHQLETSVDEATRSVEQSKWQERSLLCQNNYVLPLKFTEIKVPAIVLCCIDLRLDPNCSKCDISHDPLHAAKFTFKKIYESDRHKIFIMNYRRHLVKSAKQ